ncbi:MAG: tripartite tricarboxylate transporter substrate-binding protein, partial [Verrucomicrobiota bacterium]
LAPAGTPATVITAVHDAALKTLREADLRQTLEAQGFDIRGENAAKFGAFLKAEVAKWTRVVKNSGARVD